MLLPQYAYTYIYYFRLSLIGNLFRIWDVRPVLGDAICNRSNSTAKEKENIEICFIQSARGKKCSLFVNWFFVQILPDLLRTTFHAALIEDFNQSRERTITHQCVDFVTLWNENAMMEFQENQNVILFFSLLLNLTNDLTKKRRQMSETVLFDIILKPQASERERKIDFKMKYVDAWNKLFDWFMALLNL